MALQDNEEGLSPEEVQLPQEETPVNENNDETEMSSKDDWELNDDPIINDLIRIINLIKNEGDDGVLELVGWTSKHSFADTQLSKRVQGSESILLELDVILDDILVQYHKGNIELPKMHLYMVAIYSILEALKNGDVENVDKQFGNISELLTIDIQRGKEKAKKEKEEKEMKKENKNEEKSFQEKLEAAFTNNNNNCNSSNNDDTDEKWYQTTTAKVVGGVAAVAAVGVAAYMLYDHFSEDDYVISDGELDADFF